MHLINMNYTLIYYEMRNNIRNQALDKINSTLFMTIHNTIFNEKGFDAIKNYIENGID